MDLVGDRAGAEGEVGRGGRLILQGVMRCWCKGMRGLQSCICVL